MSKCVIRNEDDHLSADGTSWCGGGYALQSNTISAVAIPVSEGRWTLSDKSIPPGTNTKDEDNLEHATDFCK
jgi:hypothetical protein